MNPTDVRERLRSSLDYLEQLERLTLRPMSVVPVEHYCSWAEEWQDMPGVSFASEARRPPTSGEAAGSTRTAEAWLRLACPLPGKDAARERALYDRLLALQQAMEDSSAHTPLELIWGSGILLWHHPSGQRIATPLVTQSVDVRLDRETLSLEVLPRSRPPGLELGALVAVRHPDLASIEAAWRAEPRWTAGAFSPHEREALGRFLAGCAQAFGPETGLWTGDGTHSRSLPPPTATPLLVESWVLFARRRTPTPLIEDIDRLREEIDRGTPIPPGAAALVSEPGTVVAAPAESAEGQVFFPKPFNDEQLSIVRKLADAPGVVVQGPPGTGKTHTIANVICHTLAAGGRVLVTARGEAPLAVLRDHLPASLRPLAVALLTDEHEGSLQFQRAIQTIATAIARIDPAELERSIGALDARAAALTDRLNSTDAAIDRAARGQFRPVAHHGEALAPAGLAAWVVAEAARHGWFVDRLSASFSAPAIDEATIERIRAIRRALGPDLVASSVDETGHPDTDSTVRDWPDAAAMGRLHADLVRARAIEQTMAAEGTPILAADTPLALPRLGDLATLGTSVLAAHQALIALGPTGERLLAQAHADAEGCLAQLEPLVAETLAIEQSRGAFVVRPVSAPPESIEVAFAAAVARGAATGQPLGVLGFVRGALRAALAQVRVAGGVPTGAADWSHVGQWLELEARQRAVLARWRALLVEDKLAGHGPETFAHAVDVARRLSGLRTLVAEQEPAQLRLTRELFGAGLAHELIGHGIEALQRLQQVVDRNLERARALTGLDLLAGLIARVAGGAGPLAREARDFLSGTVGLAGQTHASVVDRWAGLAARLRAQAAHAPLRGELARLCATVAEAGAPRWAEALQREPVTGHADALTPADWPVAWQWRQASEYLALLEAGTALERLQAQRSELAHELEQVRADVVEQRVWLRLHGNAPPAVTAALQGCLSAIQHLSQATGARAVRLRAEARSAMRAAHPAVPCWIMPHWRVSETLPAQLGAFDLVIIDEASQSDIAALPSLLRGKRMIIVGDDQQVSPEARDVDETQITRLHERYLQGLPFASQMAPERSIYDLARVAFSHRTVMLREHFRCVRPVIAFARRAFYGPDLLPLRVPRPSERLEPALLDWPLSDGRMKGDVNEAEAHAIVDAVTALIADPAMAGRSIGVVSLHGPAQARRILAILRERHSAQTLASHAFVAGEARGLQGKERDIVFLSMVTDREWTGEVSTLADAQAFNVAASRARDRMVLVRSLGPGITGSPALAPHDWRARLIAHMANPFPEAPPPPQSLREACRSPSVRSLFDRLVRAGHRVLPAVPAGADAIDLVIEGEGDRRLAVMVDGDGGQDLESWRRALSHQRVLERAGWTVWRMFAANLLLHPATLPADLVRQLEAHGISPVADARTPAPSAGKPGRAPLQGTLSMPSHRA
jgi:hypothetical protein